MEDITINKDQFAYIVASSLTSAFFSLHAQMTVQNGEEPDQDEVIDRIADVYKELFHRTSLLLGSKP